MLSKLYTLFPIHRKELAKFSLLASLCFLVCINYTLLRTVKETLVITKPEMGIEIIPFLRTWMLMPIMLVFVKAYALLSGSLKQPQVCYIIIGFFLGFFILFTFVFYPYDEFFQMNQIGNWIAGWPIPLAEQIGAMVRYWSFSIYYCLSEVWGTMVVLILFWGVSNRSNTVDEAKRYYSPILFITNLSGFFASEISLYLSNSTLKNWLFPSQDRWSATFLSITFIVCVVTMLILTLFYILFRYLKMQGERNGIKEKPLSKKEVALFEMVKIIGKNPKILSLAIMVFAYFFTSGIMELIWKFYLRKAFPNPNDFNDYLSYCTKYISIASTFLALGVTGTVIRRFRWYVSALITPIALLVPTVGLVIICFYYDSNPILATLVGAIYYCLNRVCKFTFFDLSKEVATVELSYDDQIKSKSVLDGIIPKLGKTCESGALQILLITFGSIDRFLTLIMVFMLAVHCIWAYFMTERKQPYLIGNVNI